MTETTEFEHGFQFQRKEKKFLGENRPMQASSVSEEILTFREN